VHDWLRDEKKGSWVFILDKVDNAGFLVDEAGSLAAIGPGSDGQASNREHADLRPLLLYLPYYDHGSILMTSRIRRKALKLVEKAGFIAVGPMNKKDAISVTGQAPIVKGVALNQDTGCGYWLHHQHEDPPAMHRQYEDPPKLLEVTRVSFNLSLPTIYVKVATRILQRISNKFSMWVRYFNSPPLTKFGYNAK
jgi:hypothetical protein